MILIQKPKTDSTTDYANYTDIIGYDYQMPLKFCHETIRTLIRNNFLEICEIGGICGFQFRNLGLRAGNRCRLGSGADAVPNCPSLSNLTRQFFLQIPRNVYDHNAISPLEQKHSPKYSRSPIMQKTVVPARLDQLRNQYGDRVLRVFGFELPNIVKDWRDYFTIG